MQSESVTTGAPEGELASDDDLEVEPVATVAADPSRTDNPSLAARIERLRRLALELRVAGLEAELERVERRHETILDQYERVLEEREDTGGTSETPVFSWLARD